MAKTLQQSLNLTLRKFWSSNPVRPRCGRLRIANYIG